MTKPPSAGMKSGLKFPCRCGQRAELFTRLVEQRDAIDPGYESQIRCFSCTRKTSWSPNVEDLKSEFNQPVKGKSNGPVQVR